MSAQTHLVLPWTESNQQHKSPISTIYVPSVHHYLKAPSSVPVQQYASQLTLYRHSSIPCLFGGLASTSRPGEISTPCSTGAKMVCSMNVPAVVSICNCSQIKQSTYTDPSETFQLKCQSSTWVVEENLWAGESSVPGHRLKKPYSNVSRPRL